MTPQRAIELLTKTKDSTNWGYNKDNCTYFSGWSFSDGDRVRYRTTELDKVLISCEQTLGDMVIKIIRVSDDDTEVINNETLYIENEKFYKLVFKELVKQGKIEDISKYDPKGRFETGMNLNPLNVDFEGEDAVLRTKDATFKTRMSESGRKDGATIHQRRKELANVVEKYEFLFSEKNLEKAAKMIKKRVPTEKITKKDGFTPLELINSIEPANGREEQLLRKINFNAERYGPFGMGAASQKENTLTLSGYINNLSSGYRSLEHKIDMKKSMKDIKDGFLQWLGDDFGDFVKAEDSYARGFAEYYKNKKTCGYWLD